MDVKVLKKLINDALSKRFRNLRKQRQFLLDCIEAHGFIQERPETPDDTDDEEYDDLYQHIMPSESHQSVFNGNNLDLQQSYQEQVQSSHDPYGFNRTFISPGSNNNKLEELQKRGISYQETQFVKVKEKMEELLQRFNLEENTVLETALNMYFNILLYHENNVYNLHENRGSVKRGYILLCVYYALVYNNRQVEKQQLVDLSETTRFKDLPLADQNIKTIFKNVKGYEFLQKSFHGINYKKFFKKITNKDYHEVIQVFESILERTKNIIPLSQQGVYAIIYFVCNDYFPTRLKIVENETETFVTYKILNDFIEPVSPSTIRKIILQLRETTFNS